MEKYKIREIEDYACYGEKQSVEYNNYLKNLIYHSCNNIQKSMKNSQNTDDLYDIAQLILYTSNIINKIKR